MSNSVIALHLAWKPQLAVVPELKHLKVKKVFVYRTITCNNGTGSIAKRQGSGHKKTVTAREMVQKEERWLERNARRSANQIAKELKISDRSVCRILKNELKIKLHKVQKAHDLSLKQQQSDLKEQKSFYTYSKTANF